MIKFASRIGVIWGIMDVFSTMAGGEAEALQDISTGSSREGKTVALVTATSLDILLVPSSVIKLSGNIYIEETVLL